MPNEPDYQKAYEILDEALGDAIHILQKARLRRSYIESCPPGS